MKKSKEPITITDNMLKNIYSKLVNITSFKRQLYEVNKNLGSYQEPDDYAQEVLICLNKKLSTNEVVFYNEPQLWTYCVRILNMLLLRQHRDYTSTKSRKGFTVNIDNELDSGKTIDDIVSLQHFDRHSTIEARVNYNFYKNYIISISKDSVSINHISKLFTVDKNARLLNLYSFLENIRHRKLKDIFKIYNIKKELQIKLINSILNYFNYSNNTKQTKHNFYSISTELSNRDKQILKNIKNSLKDKNTMSFEKFKSILV